MEDKNLKVTEILDDRAKHGTSQKTGKEWSQARVSLSNGESVFMFNPVKVGDEVMAVQNGEYTNYQVVKPDPKHDEIMKALRLIYEAVSGKTSQPAAGQRKPVEDPVFEPEDKPISLDDIPF